MLLIVSRPHFAEIVFSPPLALDAGRCGSNCSLDHYSHSTRAFADINSPSATTRTIFLKLNRPANLKLICLSNSRSKGSLQLAVKEEDRKEILRERSKDL